MNTPSTITGEEVINGIIESQDSAENVLRELERKKDLLEGDERRKVERYIADMRMIFRSMVIDDLGGNTAGLYDGNDIFIDRKVMGIGESVDETVSRAQEVYEHEKYHAENNHMEPLQIVGETRGDIAAVIGGQEFNTTELIEGLTVMETGNQFVSDGYRGYERDLQQAMEEADLEIEEIRAALNKDKDLRKIDDRMRQPEKTLAA